MALNTYPSQSTILCRQLAFRKQLLFVNEIGFGDGLDAAQTSLLNRRQSMLYSKV